MEMVPLHLCALLIYFPTIHGSCRIFGHVENPISPKGIYSFINCNPILTFITLNLPLTLLWIASPLLTAYFGGIATATRQAEGYVFIKMLIQLIHISYIMMTGGIKKQKQSHSLDLWDHFHQLDSLFAVWWISKLKSTFVKFNLIKPIKGGNDSNFQHKVTKPIVYVGAEKESKTDSRTLPFTVAKGNMLMVLNCLHQCQTE